MDIRTAFRTSIKAVLILDLIILVELDVSITNNSIRPIVLVEARVGDLDSGLQQHQEETAVPHPYHAHEVWACRALAVVEPSTAVPTIVVLHL